MAERLGVAGRPILHSRSPQLFRAAFTSESSSYLRLTARSAAGAIELARTIELDGFNVTAPFKTAMAAQVEACDEVAQQVGAVNTVVCGDGTLRGYNTDATGAVEALREHGVELAERRVIVFGTGGAGRAAAFGAARAGAQRVTLVSREADRARRAAAPLATDWCALVNAQSAVAEADVLISCVPPKASVIDRCWLRSDLAVMDANYGTSTLSAHARAAGCVVVPGHCWLLHQAASAHERFVGRPAPLQAMRRQLLAGEQRPVDARSNIALVGFMGAGKSTVGPLLAERLRMHFVDTDEVCEQRAGKSIGDLFHQAGEPAFRAIERDVLGEVVRARRTVFACGGGALLDDGSRLMIRQHCLVIWLSASLDLCAARAGRGGRPLLSAGATTEPVEELARRRSKSYRHVAGLVIDAGSASPIAIADELSSEIQRARDP